MANDNNNRISHTPGPLQGLHKVLELVEAVEAAAHALLLRSRHRRVSLVAGAVVNGDAEALLCHVQGQVLQVERHNSR